MEPQRLISLKANLQQQRATTYERIIRWMWRLIAAGLVIMTIVFVSINFMAIPSFRELEDPNSALASEVLASNNEVLGRYFTENRVPVPYEDLSPNLVNALIANEDVRFREHCGIDARAVGRVIVRTVLLSDQSSGGGSTITQQLAKMLYSDRDFRGLGTVRRTMKLFYMKLREWITAVKLERSYTKEEILAMYLNQFNFINNAYGIHAASEVYFGKNQSELKVEEAATLIGMLQNPSYFNPVRFPERSIRRRWTVLSQMRKNGYLSEAQFDQYKVKPLDMSKFTRVNFTDDKAPYLCSELKKDVNRILEAEEARRPDGSKYNIYKDGLKIYTTIDPVFQQHAEAAVQEQMRKLQNRFFTVWKGRDPWSYRGSKTKPEEIEDRKERLDDLLRDGDRYQALRPKFLDALTEQIQKKYNIDLRDADISRMLKEEKTPGSTSKLLAVKWITVEQAAAYRKIMGGREWPEIKKQYAALQVAIRKQYTVKTKMKVFTWNSPRFEKDTIMSPMDSLRYHRMFLQTGVLAVDPTTSEIKAWVGGINFKWFQYDHIRTDRQVGSTFKPFVYATAIAQQGISPCFEVYDQAVTIPAHYQNFGLSTDWTPKNSTGIYSGARMTLKDALKNSVNSVSVYLMKQMGDVQPVIGLCNNMGIDSTRHRIPNAAAICLGVSDLTVMEMVGAYTTFANKGMYGQPFVIRKIEDKNGRVLYRSVPDERVALPQNVNYVMTQMLKYNVQGAPGINSLKSDIGGKTGTTDDFSDGWFMAITPRLVVGTWVGGEDRWIRFLNIGDGQGARMARPICASFIGRLEKDAKSGYDFNAKFTRPAGDLGIEINCAAYQNGPRPTGGEDEEFAPDIYNDQAPTDEESVPTPTPASTKPGDKKTPAKKPDDGFGDQ